MGSLFVRIREMVSAHAHHTVDQAENPHVMAQQVLRDLGDDLQQAQAALVSALGAEKRLTHQREQMLAEALEWESRAERLLGGGKEDLARGAVDKAVAARARAQQQLAPLTSAQRSVARMRAQVQRLRQEWEGARHRCAQISSNQAAAEALGAAGRAGDHYSRAMDRATRLERLTEKSARFESEADAAAELLDEQGRFEREISNVDHAAAVDETLARLKSRLAGAAPAAT